MRSINKVQLIGNLGKDPELRQTDSQVKVASFSLATSDQYTDKNSGEKKEFTDWHNIVAWRGLAEICEKFLKKGSKVYIEGKLRTRSWKDQDGRVIYKTEIIAETMLLLGKSNSAEHQAPDFEEQTDGDDDLPF